MAEDLLEGDVVAGRYRLDHILGEGGMGLVWAATHTVTRRAVAVKFLLGPLNTRPDMRERFLREARAAVAVDHPNVVEIFDVFELDDGTPVMVMPLLRGETFEARLERDEKLPLADVAEVLLPVVSAVGTAHDRGIVHRDLKPDNVFLAMEGSKEVVKVLDFGIAKLLARDEPTAGGKPVTAAGTMLGTLCYMSPEQAFGERDVDHRADVWAIGVMLYKALTGLLPVEGDHIGQVMKNLMTKSITPIESLLPSLPADVSSLVMRMLARERHERPADLREVYETLSRHAASSAPTFGPPQIAPIESDAPPPADESRRLAASTSGSIQRSGRGVDPGARTMAADQVSATGAHAFSVADVRTRNWTILGLSIGAVMIALIGWRVGRSTPASPTVVASSANAPSVVERTPTPAVPPPLEATVAAPVPTPSSPAAASAALPPASAKGSIKGRPRPAAAPSVRERPQAPPSPAPRTTEGLHEDVPF